MYQVAANGGLVPINSSNIGKIFFNGLFIVKMCFMGPVEISRIK